MESKDFLLIGILMIIAIYFIIKAIKEDSENLSVKEGEKISVITIGTRVPERIINEWLDTKIKYLRVGKTKNLEVNCLGVHYLLIVRRCPNMVLLITMELKEQHML